MPLICPVAFKSGARNTFWSIKFQLARTKSGSLPASERAQCSSVKNMSKDEELTTDAKQLWDLECHGTVSKVNR